MRRREITAAMLASSRAGVGATVRICGVAFRNVGCVADVDDAGRLWRHDAEAGGRRYQLTLHTRTNERRGVVLFQAGLHINPHVFRLEHSEWIWRPTGAEIRRAVAPAVAHMRQMPDDHDDALSAAYLELDRPGTDRRAKIPMRWAVRESADAGWLQRAWDECEDAHVMARMLATLPAAGSTGLKLVFSYKGQRRWRSTVFPNSVACTELRWPSRVVAFRGDSASIRRGADMIREVVPTLPTIAEMLAAQVAAKSV